MDGGGDGPARPERVDATALGVDLARLRTSVAYLQAVTLAPEDLAGGPAGDPGWIPTPALLEAGGVLARLLGADRRGRFAVDRRVAASSFFQGAALRALGTGAGLWLTTGRVPDLSVGATAYALEVDLPARLALVASTPAGTDAEPSHPVSGDVGWFAERAFGEHLDPLAEAIRREVRIGEATLWGNAAAALAGVVVDVVRSLPPGGRAAGLAEGRRLVEALPHRLARYGEWAEVADGPGREVFWLRRTCCLWYLEDPERRLCDTCNLLGPAERRQRLIRQVARRRASGPGPG